MEVAPRGAEWVVAVKAVAHLDAQGMVLSGTLFCRHHGGGGW